MTFFLGLCGFVLFLMGAILVIGALLPSKEPVGFFIRLVRIWFGLLLISIGLLIISTRGSNLLFFATRMFSYVTGITFFMK